MHVLGSRQRQLLHLLLRNRAGRTVDEIATDLGISATAVRQHIATLESHGYVERGTPRRTAGRPGLVFLLAARGRELFPREYAGFAALLLSSLEAAHGSTGLASYLQKLAAELAASLTATLGEPQPRLPAFAAALNGMGYDAEVVEDPARPPELHVHNCVYHSLAQRYPQVCRFDTEMLSQASGRRVEHLECLVRDGACCRFRFGAAAT